MESLTDGQMRMLAPSADPSVVGAITGVGFSTNPSTISMATQHSSKVPPGGALNSVIDGRTTLPYFCEYIVAACPSPRRLDLHWTSIALRRAPCKLGRRR